MMIMMMMVMVMMIQNAVKSVGRFGVVLARRPSRPAHRHDLMKSTQSDYQHYRQHQNEYVGNGVRKKHCCGLLSIVLALSETLGWAVRKRYVYLFLSKVCVYLFPTAHTNNCFTLLSIVLTPGWVVSD